MSASDFFVNGVVDLPELRDRAAIFRDRTHAGTILTRMLDSFANTETLVLGIPAGGVPVAVVIAEHLHLPLDILVVSKITLPWNTETCYGEVAFDGTVRLNEKLLPHLGLSEQEIQRGIQNVLRKVTRRLKALRGEHAFPGLSKKPVILVDDGLASGFTLLVGVKALRNVGAKNIIVAVPTGHWDPVQMMARRVEAVYCTNVLQGRSFAVADAYQRWPDVSEEEVAKVIQESRNPETL